MKKAAFLLSMLLPVSFAAADMGVYEYQPCILTNRANLNCDDVVDMRDLAILAANWLADVGD
jgi:hypothetical protein